MGAWFWIVLMLVFFFLRNFYFAAFELAWRGMTPGKRVFGLRVIDRGGGTLRADAIFARNLMREVEVFIPAMILMIGPFMGGEGGGVWLYLMLLGWMGVLTLLPLFNKDRLRAGDLIGGTWVILAPKAVLLPDLAAMPAAASAHAAVDATVDGLRFSRQHLSVYGVEELQTLEHILRQEGPHAAQVRDEVARRIQRKIGWQAPGQPVEPRAFRKFLRRPAAASETRHLFKRRQNVRSDRTGTTPARRSVEYGGDVFDTEAFPGAPQLDIRNCTRDGKERIRDHADNDVHALSDQDAGNTAKCHEYDNGNTRDEGSSQRSGPHDKYDAEEPPGVALAQVPAPLQRSEYARILHGDGRHRHHSRRPMMA
jgi:uncharacterized RDD family membrane protein YckC